MKKIKKNKLHRNSKKKIICMSSIVLLGILFNQTSSIILSDDVSSPNASISKDGVETKSDLEVKTDNSEVNATNLLKNGDFSQTEAKSGLWTGEKASDWTAWIDSKSAGGSDKKIAVENGQLILSSSDTFRAVVHQTVTIDPSKKYKLRFKIKTSSKVGLARVRIIEEKDGKKNLWYSKNTSNTTNDWLTIEDDYTPSLDTSTIKMELFYETGTGVVSFDDLELIEANSKEAPKAEELHKSPELEKEVTLPVNKKYLFNDSSYVYAVENPSVAKVENGLLIPLTEGNTVIKVTKEGKEISSIPLNVTASVDDDYTRLLDDWNDIIAGNRYFDSTNSYMSKFNDDLEKKVTQNLATIKTDNNRSFLWEEQSDYKKSANITATYRRLEEIAKQVTNPKSKYYQNEQAIRTVRESIDWLHNNVYNTSKEITGNWWDYEIGTPRALNNTLSLMKEYFSDSEIKMYTDVIEKFVPDPEYFRKTTDKPFEALGGNLIDMGRVKVIAGLLRKDDSEVSSTIKSIEKVFTLVNQGEGFYQDGSYIAHTNVAYTGAYGNVLIDGLSQLLPIIQKTKTPVSEDKLQSIYHWIDHSFLPLIVHGELMDLSRGRSISRSNSQAHVAAIEVLRGINRVAEISNDETKLRLKTLIKSIVSEDTFYTSYDNLKTYRDISLMNSLLSDNSISVIKRPSYISAFNNMDKLAMYQADRDFGFGLSLFSNRTKNYEDMNNENRKGWYTGDGMFYLYNGDLAHYSTNYWATVNPYRMPGTTETNAKREDGSGQDVLPSGFVGTSRLNDNFASTAMDFTNWNKTLSLHKGWIILNDKVVFLGSDIKNTSTDLASTTIEQRKVDTNNPYRVFVNGKETTLSIEENLYKDTRSVFLESNGSNRNIGYFFLKNSDLKMFQQTQKGAWKDINSSQSEEQLSNEFITISQEHSKDNDSYAYVMVPNIDRASFDKLTATMNDMLVENTSNLQVAYDAGNQVWGVIKYDDGDSTVGNNFIVKKRGIYTIKKTQDDYQVAYYNPESQTTADTSEVFEKLAQEVKDTNKQEKESISLHDNQNQNKKKKPQAHLPQTGEHMTVFLILVGLCLSVIGFSIFVKKRLKD